MGYEFTLVLDRVPSDDDLDALFNAGCADAIFEIVSGDSCGHFEAKCGFPEARLPSLPFRQQAPDCPSV